MKKVLVGFLAVANVGVLCVMSLRIIGLETGIEKLDAVMARNQGQLEVVGNQISRFSKELEDAKHVKLEIPKSTEREIADAFKNVATQIQSEVTNAVIRQGADATKEFKSIAESRLNETLTSFEKTLPADLMRQAEEVNAIGCATITNAIGVANGQLCGAITDAMETRLDRAASEIGKRIPVSQIVELQKSVQTLIASNRNRSGEFLSAAERHDNHEIKNLLYIAAVNAADEKKNALKKYAAWVEMEVERLLKNNDSDEAKTRYDALLSVFNAAVNDGSVADVDAIPEMRQELDRIGNKIVSYDQAQLALAKEVIDSIENELVAVTSTVQCIELSKKLEESKIPDQLIASRDQLAEKIAFYQSCLTLPSEPVIVPPINERTPWVLWFENFVKRMNADTLSRDARLTDLASISDFYSAAKKMDDARLVEVMKSLDTITAKLYVEDWDRRVKDLIASDSVPCASQNTAGKAAELIQEAKNFDRSFYDDCRSGLISLNELLLREAEREIDQSLRTIKDLDGSMSRNCSAQLVGVVQGQCLQMIMKIASLQVEFPGDFNERMASFKTKIEGLETVLAGYREYARVKELENAKRQREAFLIWAKQTIDDAEKLYNEGEGLANQWKYTRGSEVCQKKYRMAWNKIMRIYEPDLSMEDPAMHDRYSKVKAKIEKARPPDENELKNRTYQRRESF